jgi:hypothetical protein
MKIILNDRSSTRPITLLRSATSAVYRTNVRKETEIIDEREETVYISDAYFFDGWEYDFVRNGILPSEAEWDDVLRSIERSALYDNADLYITKYTTDVADADKAKAWIDYKGEVRATVNQDNYPTEVTYPDLPE